MILRRHWTWEQRVIRIAAGFRDTARRGLVQLGGLGYRWARLDEIAAAFIRGTTEDYIAVIILHSHSCATSSLGSVWLLMQPADGISQRSRFFGKNFLA